MVAKVLGNLCKKTLDVIDEGIIDTTLLTDDEMVFVAKLEEHIKQRAVRFKEVAREMPLVSF